MISIYVLPTEEGQPPRAMIADAEMVQIEEDEETLAVAIQGGLAMWSADSGAWMVDDHPVPADLGAAISEHAHDLGVAGF